MTQAQDFDASVLMLKTDVGIAHQIIHGDETTSVQTANGLVDSFAKVIADNKRKVEGALDVQIKYVSKNALPGQYTSVAAALASITDASAAKPYLVLLRPGVYTEPVLQMKEYVQVRGAGQDVTYIKPADLTKDFVLGANNSAFTDATVMGPSTKDMATFLMDEPQGLTNQLFRLERLVFGASDTLVRSASGYVAVTACTLGEKNSFRRGFIAQDKGTKDARVTLRNVNTNGMTAPYPETLCMADGTHSQILVLSSMARASANLDNASGVGVGIHVRNGGHYRVVGGSLIGFAKGIWAENVGAAPLIECVGINLISNTQDIAIDHPGTKGSIQGSARRSSVTVNPAATNLSLFYTDQDGHGLVNVGPLYVGKTHSTTSDIQPMISRGTPLGVLEGGSLTSLGGFQVKVGAGVGYVRVDGWLRKIEWPDTTVIVPANAITYIQVNETSVIGLSNSFPENVTTITLGRLIANDTGVMMIGSMGSSHIETYHSNLDKLLRLAFGPVYISGSVITENATTPRALDVTAGHYFYSTLERLPNAKVAPPLNCIRPTATGVAADRLTQLDNTKYLSGTSFVNLTAGYFAKYMVYTNGDGDDANLILGYPIAQYATVQEARDGANTPPVIPPEGSPLIAAVIVQQGRTNIVEVLDLRPKLGAALSGGMSQITDHGDLIGLGDDDHTQYLRTDGKRAMSGPLDMGNNLMQNVKSVNGVDVAAHASRHAPNGADPLATGVPVSVTTATSNGEGVANSFARSDHTHSVVGFQPTSVNLTAISALGGIGIAKRGVNNTWSIAALTASEIPALDWGKITSGKPTTLAGYGITDAVPGNLGKVYKGSVPIMSGSSTINMGNTAPTATQGTQIFSRTVTPQDAQSSFMIRFDGSADANVSSTKTTGTSTVMATLFRSINGGAWTFIGLGTASVVLMDNPTALSFNLEDSPNTTLPVTYMARIGISGATAWYLGRTTSYSLGGTNPSGYTIMEVRP
jgi:hypothetical protein